MKQSIIQENSIKYVVTEDLSRVKVIIHVFKKNLLHLFRTTHDVVERF